jgi:hypothetical protein
MWVPSRNDGSIVASVVRDYARKRSKLVENGDGDWQQLAHAITVIPAFIAMLTAMKQIVSDRAGEPHNLRQLIGKWDVPEI